MNLIDGIEAHRRADAGRRVLHDGIEIGVLGPFEVRSRRGDVPVEGSKQRALLAVLALDANHVVSSDRLMESLWGQALPPTAPKMLQVFVSRLRRTLELAGVAKEILVTQRPGYVLKLEPDQLDLRRFEMLVARARSAAQADSALAAKTFREALSLWRGSPLADLALEPFAQMTIRSLEELRVNILEERLDAELRSGRHRELVGELRDLIVDEPLRERLRMQLILALYRSGRQAEALEAYRDARRTLTQELGIEPGPELRRLERAILHHDPELEWRAGARGDHRPARSDRPEPDAADAPPVAREGAQADGQSKRLPVILAAVALVTVLVAALVLIAAGGTPRSSSGAVSIRGNSVAAVDPKTGVPVADIVVGAAPGPVAFGDGYVWVGSGNDHTVSKIEPRSGQVVKTFGLSAAPATLAVEGGIVWIGNAFTGTLSRILVPYDQLSAPFFPGPAVSGLLAISTTRSDLWAGLGNGALLRLDPASLRVKAQMKLSGHPDGIVATDTALWFIQFVNDSVMRTDLNLRSRIRSIPLAGEPQAITAGYGSIWVATSPDDRLWRIDPSSATIDASVPLGEGPTAIAAFGGEVWVAAGHAGILEQIDPGTNTLVRTIRLGHPLGGLAVGAGRLWLTLD